MAWYLKPLVTYVYPWHFEAQRCNVTEAYTALVVLWVLLVAHHPINSSVATTYYHCECVSDHLLWYDPSLLPRDVLLITLSHILSCYNIICTSPKSSTVYRHTVLVSTKALREHRSPTGQLTTSILPRFAIWRVAIRWHSFTTKYPQSSYSKHIESANLHQGQIVIQITTKI